MSGEHFYGCEPSAVGSTYCGQWRDEELNALFFDLFGCGWKGYRMPHTGRLRKAEFGDTKSSDEYTGGLAEALDMYLDCDISEETYREQVARFKRKWLAKRTPKNRVEFYQSQFEEYAKDIIEKFKEELGEI